MAYLRELIQEEKYDDAVELCRAQLARQSGSPYYSYWLERLTAPGAANMPGPPRPAGAMGSAALKQALLDDFAEAPYRIPPHQAPDDLEQARTQIISTMPFFRSEIYLPTAKIPLDEQVRGLARVQALVQAENHEASRRRFDALKAHLATLGKDRIFVIGNGPSLKRTDLSLLKDEVTIGFNGIFLHDSFTPTIYLVEDHLVAEDRKDEIHAYECFVKVFPSYLGYCIAPQDNTLFLNHRPRISYPVDTDFSADAGEITYTGGTVTYTGLQLAASLGFREIILVGVDASYQVHDVDRSDSYGTGVLTSKSDDANHFDPRYFGKGYRWHDPNVDKMLQAYRKARNWGQAHGVNVVNATLGGELEVFPRVDFHALFPRTRVFPRIAVLDFTAVTQLCATGVVKQNLLAGWPRGAQLHVSSPNEGRLVAFQTIPQDLYAEGADIGHPWAAFRSLVEFNPDVLYLRPTHDRVVMTLLQAVAAAVLGKPWTIHYMDDWLEKCKVIRTPEVAAAHATIMRMLVTGASRAFSICGKMSDMLAERYDLPPERVVVAHNFLPAAQAPSRRRAREEGSPLVIRYLGGLEPDMGLASLVDLAGKIEAWNARAGSEQVRLEIHAREHGIKNHGALFEPFASTTLLPQFADYADYLEALGTSDLNLICYNFDERSVDYVRYSLANKLPELLAAKVPFFAVGHHDIGTMQVLADAGYPFLANDTNYTLDDMLGFVQSPSAEAVEAYRAAITRLKEEFSDARNQVAFQQALRQAAAAAPGDVGDLDALIGALCVLLGAAQPALQKVRDLDCLLRLVRVDRAVVARALARVRDHGLTWSTRTTLPGLRKACPDAATLAGQDEATRANALAFLICSLGGDTHDYPVVNDVVREWLRAHHPLPTDGQ